MNQYGIFIFDFGHYDPRYSVMIIKYQMGPTLKTKREKGKKYKGFLITPSFLILDRLTLRNLNLILKDKSRRNTEPDQFQLKSRIFYNYPLYDHANGTNYDICLVKTPPNEFGIHEDLSSRFDSIPCLPKNTDLEQVCHIRSVGYHMRHIL